jgi:hypothetical protein
VTAYVVEDGLDDMGRDAKLGHAGSGETLAIMQLAQGFDQGRPSFPAIRQARIPGHPMIAGAGEFERRTAVTAIRRI